MDWRVIIDICLMIFGVLMSYDGYKRREFYLIIIGNVFCIFAGFCLYFILSTPNLAVHIFK
jgi:hypothetical protein